YPSLRPRPNTPSKPQAVNGKLLLTAISIFGDTISNKRLLCQLSADLDADLDISFGVWNWGF
ncbi:MAG: hypothetical protein ACE5I0_10355, partial [Candidatus Binatia bacterium]